MQYAHVFPLAFVDGAVEKTVTLSLPKGLVNGSAMASVSVLGEFYQLEPF